MKKYNNKKDQATAHEAMLAMLIIFIVMILTDYIAN